MYKQLYSILLISVSLCWSAACTRPEVTRSPKKISVKSSTRNRDASPSEAEVIALAEAAALEFRVPAKRHVVIIDYDRSLFSERLFVVDMKQKSVILRSRVSHAMKSGKIFASNFSNQPATEQSCIGAFRTGESYNGRFGYAMRIDGLEHGVNDKARQRAIVFHNYKAPVAYSRGCFMTPPDVNRKLINIIKGGSLVYVRKT
jgi:hypothetical protein